MIFVELDGRCDDLPVYGWQQQKPGSPVNPKRLNTASRQLRSGGSNAPLFTQATRHATGRNIVTFGRRFLFGLVGLSAVLLATGLPASAQQPQQKPNILFIMGDDIGWMQPSIYHQGLMVGETPNIDRIGQEGARFLTYYAEQSCTAGRTAFFTGMNPLRVGMTLPEIPGSPSYLRPGTRQVPA
jgi:arylsulfatase